jgi:hypothetical protein
VITAPTIVQASIKAPNVAKDEISIKIAPVTLTA